MQFSRIRLSVWKFVFIVPDPRILSESFHFGHDGIVQLGRAVYGSPHHLRIAPFDRPFSQYISHPHVLCLPFSRRGPSLHGHCPLPRYYGLVRLLASLSLPRGLPSSLAELSEHATLLCPAAFPPPKSIRRHPFGFTASELLATRNFGNETLRKRFTCVIAYPFVRRDSRTSVALCTPRLPNCTSTSLQ